MSALLVLQKQALGFRRGWSVSPFRGRARLRVKAGSQRGICWRWMRFWLLTSLHFRRVSFMPEDYSRQDLRGRHFRGAELSGASLIGVDISMVDLGAANTEGAIGI